MILIIITYLAGVLTILSPCILPVLPFVFSRAQGSFVKSSLPILIGMSLTFSLLSALAIVGGSWIAQANEAGRIIALCLLTMFGLFLIFPQISEKLLGPLTEIGSKIGGSNKDQSIWGSLLVGVSTGLLWAPCAGPILGLVLTGAASQKNTAASIGLLLAYSLGAATSLALALVAGNKFLGSLKKFLGVDQVVKKVLGVAVLLGVLAIVFNLDRTVLAQLSKVGTTSIEEKLLSYTDIKKNKEEKTDEVPVEMPELNGGEVWLNSAPLSKKDLLGKVVVIDFWTYSCINCIRTLPYVKSWAEKYKNDGLVVIGVHTPEFAFEKSEDNVKNALKDFGITYPVVLDNDYTIWDAFDNSYWPAHYFVDRKGKIRHHHFGEGEYEQSEAYIKELLTENGETLQAKDTVVKGEGIQAKSTSEQETSSETYVGYKRAENFSGIPSGLQKDLAVVYQASKDLQPNRWSFSGKWFDEGERAILKQAHGKILYNFYGNDLHLVLGSSKKIKFKVTIDGKAPGVDHGVDINEAGEGEIDGQRLYQLLRLKNNKGGTPHLFEIEFSEGGAEAYAFTFG
ncbi:MAG: cytochrome c biogenesis protein DipZ [Pseudobdellovibrio sp.]